jgi:CheY-like chemotaxis protein
VSVTVRAAKILLVDDDADSAEALAMLLRLDGHEVQTAFSGTAALAVAESFTPQVAFIDIGMPGMTGIELAHCLRRREALANTKLVALTGLSVTSVQDELNAAGFAMYCNKPLSMESLYEVLRRVEDGTWSRWGIANIREQASK